MQKIPNARLSLRVSEAIRCSQSMKGLSSGSPFSRAWPSSSRYFCTGKPSGDEKIIDVEEDGSKPLDPEVEEEKVSPEVGETVDLEDLLEKNWEKKDVPTASESKGETTESHGFQAETRRILDIVANSLYTDKEVFLRELISNASDALEKARYLRNTDMSLSDSEKEFEMHIMCDKEKNQLIIQDFGVGMSKEELIEHLGTIAKSGSKEFIKNLDSMGSSEATENIIGQFGVGFYSVFMVADKVEVYSKSADPSKGDAHYWTSTGDGTYNIGKAEGVQRGTKIIMHLKEDEKNFSEKRHLEDIIDKYSNFIGFPMYLNVRKLNMVQAIWTRSKSDVTEEQHLEFYRYISGSYDAPRYTLHFTADVPIQINSIFYVGESHTEKYGMARMEPGVSLYSRKVLITPKSKKLLPEWLRFVKGVVDSEDIPLNISRENMQDSALINKINNVLTKKLISFFADEAKKDPTKYEEFHNEFSTFLKEGVCTDYVNKEKIARLLRFQTSLEKDEGANDKVKMQSLDDYVSRMKIGQKAIYYLCAPNREMALGSPYMETFKKNGTEVLLLYQPIDEFVMKNLMEFNGRKLLSVESSEASKEHDDKKELPKSPIGDDLVQYLSNALASKVSSVSVTNRLVDSPAVIVDHDSAHYRKMMQMMEQKKMALPKQKLEINPHHPIMKQLHSVQGGQPEIAQLVAEQIFDNALIAADVLDNPRSMLPRLNTILKKCMEGGGATAATEEDDKVEAATSESSGEDTASAEDTEPKAEEQKA